MKNKEHSPVVIWKKIFYMLHKFNFIWRFVYVHIKLNKLIINKM